MAPANSLGTEPARKNVDGAALLKYLAQWRKVSQYYYGDYYPLTPYATTAAEWMGWQFDLPSKSEGMIQVFRRAESPFESARLPLRGLEKAARYAVTDMDSDATRQFTGDELMIKGLPIAIGVRPGSALIVYRKVQ
jgi:alpha-galactosidase